MHARGRAEREGTEHLALAEPFDLRELFDDRLHVRPGVEEGADYAVPRVGQPP